MKFQITFTNMIAGMRHAPHCERLGNLGPGFFEYKRKSDLIKSSKAIKYFHLLKCQFYSEYTDSALQQSEKFLEQGTNKLANNLMA